MVWNIDLARPKNRLQGTHAKMQNGARVDSETNPNVTDTIADDVPAEENWLVLVNKVQAR